eukprot:72487-Rhodomonas_salina.6
MHDEPWQRVGDVAACRLLRADRRHLQGDALRRAAPSTRRVSSLFHVFHIPRLSPSLEACHVCASSDPSVRHSIETCSLELRHTCPNQSGISDSTSSRVGVKSSAGA